MDGWFSSVNFAGRIRLFDLALQGENCVPCVPMPQNRRAKGICDARRGDHPCHLLKHIFKHRKVRCRGRAKSGHQLYTLFGLANVIIGARQATT
jgi:hypothetical protein